MKKQFHSAMRQFFGAARWTVPRLAGWCTRLAHLGLVLLLFAFLGTLVWRLFAQDPLDVLEVLRVAIWPLIVLISLFFLSKPLTEFLESTASRITRFSAFDIEFELGPTTATSAVPLPSMERIKAPMDAIMGGDSSAALFEHLEAEGKAEYAVVDLGEGQEWLTSRVFIVASLFPRMRGVRTIVFLHSFQGAARVFLGCAAPREVRWRFAQTFPWLEVEMVCAECDVLRNRHGDPRLISARERIIFNNDGALDPYEASQIAETFIRRLRPDGPGPHGSDWVLVHGAEADGVWERAEWLTASRLRMLLGDTMSRSRIVEDPDADGREYAARILRRSGEFVGQLDEAGVFLRLLDRRALVEEAAALLASSLPESRNGER